MKKYFPILFIAIVGVIGVIVVLSKTSDNAANEQSLQTRIDNVNDEYKNGTLTREEANSHFCNMVVRSEAEQQKAIEAIKEYANDPNMSVEYVCNNFSPNNPNEKPTEETYLSDNKYYFIEISSNKVTRVQ